MSGNKPVPALPAGAFIGRETFRQHIRDGLAAAAHAGWPEIILGDANFDDWPLGEGGVIADLNTWAMRGQRLVMLACNYDNVARLHPRFGDWRRRWSHKIECLALETSDALELPSILWSPSWALRRHDRQRSSGHCGSEPERIEGLREWLANCLGRAAPAFPADALGL